MTERWRLDGRVALVTGASRGIGAAIATELLSLGAEVMLVARGAVDLEAAVAERQARGWAASGVAADISTSEGRGLVIDAVRARWDRLDVLVNNAGTNIRVPTLDVTEADWHRLIDQNVTGAFLLCQAAHGWLVASGQGSVVNVSSARVAPRSVIRAAAVSARMWPSVEASLRMAPVQLASPTVR